MAYTRLDTHVQDALARLTSAYAQADNVRGLVAVFAGQVQRIEDALWAVAQGQLQKGGTLGTAQLDALGRIVGQSREGLDNATYTALVLGQVGINCSDGTARSLEFIASQMFQTSSVFLSDPKAPVYASNDSGTLNIGVGDPQTPRHLFGRLLGLLNEAAAAGVQISSLSVFSSKSSLCCDGPQAWVAGLSDPDGNGGGVFADVFFM